MVESAALSILTPFLWFHGNAEEAVIFYLSVFPGARKTGEMQTFDGKPITIAFDLLGTHFTALNGDREYPFNNSISFVVTCDDQAAIDYYWDRLTGAGGKEGRCGWLTDRFGVAWQVVPRNLGRLLETPAAMAALLKMNKLDISTFETAASVAGSSSSSYGLDFSSEMVPVSRTVLTYPGRLSGPIPGYSASASGVHEDES